MYNYNCSSNVGGNLTNTCIPHMGYPSLSVGGLQNYFHPAFTYPHAASAFYTTCPNVDLFECSDCYEIHLDAPGYTSDDISIVVEGTSVVIKGFCATKNTPWLKKTSEHSYSILCNERGNTSFFRQFMLPDVCDKNINATMKNGVLCIVLPKGTNSKSSKVSDCTWSD
ncbi:Hsp20/alpha crystallin family protein [Fluoribacter gormanii]|uniref:Hsp20/alpha crystallin family protein n=1 Tax=Fluoribacter gormanii TaxID=464 RepID=UPI0010419887|nr:Hsp20/alpha crystallin family protein [Fluoribacter gormanii]